MPRAFGLIGGIAVALAAATLLSGCAQKPGTAFVGTWGNPGATGTPSLELRPQSDDGTGSVRGNDGCNAVVGTYTVAKNGDTITLEVLARTRMFCADIDTWLLNATTAKLSGEELVLRAADGARIGALVRHKK